MVAPTNRIDAEPSKPTPYLYSMDINVETMLHLSRWEVINHIWIRHIKQKRHKNHNLGSCREKGAA